MKIDNITKIEMIIAGGSLFLLIFLYRLDLMELFKLVLIWTFSTTSFLLIVEQGIKKRLMNKEIHFNPKFDMNKFIYGKR